jgi:predicted Fe-S protein YdhL (DUF1289 family)
VIVEIIGRASIAAYHKKSMFPWKSPPPKPILTPCIGVCELDVGGLCKGCHRTLDEIARWSAMSDAERLRLMDEVLPQRESRPAA